MIGDAVLNLRRRWRRVAPDSLEPSMGAHHAPSLAREGPAHRTSATRMNSTVRLRSGGRRREGSVQLQCSADGQPIQVATPNASVPAKRASCFAARWTRDIRRRWWRVAPDRHAPWMARGERPWMARAGPPQHVATSAVISAPHRQSSAFLELSSTTHRSNHY